MKKQGFWHENEGYIDAVMNKVNTLAEDTYIYMLHLSQNRVWFSETTRAYFGIRNTYAPVEAIILSMTKEERANPSILNPSRKQRIARGAGVGIQEVNRIVKQFDQMKKMLKDIC